MEKIIGAFEARREFGRLLRGAARGDTYVVERHGEPVAAVVPIELLEQWKRARQEFFEELVRMAEGSDLPAGEAEELVKREVAAARAD
jgi:prevent-host-death family protein